VWSPDGRWLAFESFRGGRRGVYCAYRDTVRVSAMAVEEDSDCWHPAWSPDGKSFAFVSNRTGDAEIYIADFRSRKTRRLTQHPGLDAAPAWRPERAR